MFVQKYVQQFAKIWWESNTQLPQFGRTYSHHDKSFREVYLEQFLQTIDSEKLRSSICGENCSETQKKFLFGYGAYLQLLDDLQDVQEDCDAGLLTVFSHASRHSSLDTWSNRIFHFGNQVMDDVDCFEGKNSDTFLNLIKKSVVLLIIEAVGLADEFYQQSYIRELERYSPFQFSYLKKRRCCLSPLRISMMNLLNELNSL